MVDPHRGKREEEKGREEEKRIEKTINKLTSTKSY
jgi:hypothetical protein